MTPPAQELQAEIAARAEFGAWARKLGVSFPRTKQLPDASVGYDDLTCKLPPDGWARRVEHAYRKWRADRIVAEVNQGGQLVETVLRTVDSSLPITTVHASQGKAIRAEPIAAVYEQGKVHHVGAFPELEDELCTWVPGQASSPDRLDALVWAFTQLQPGRVAVSAPRLRRREPWHSTLRERAGA